MFGHTVSLLVSNDHRLVSPIGYCAVIIGGLYDVNTESNKIDCIELSMNLTILTPKKQGK
jgi:hypothetical protein